MVARGIEILASNQVIGEAYVTVQHHYGLSANEAHTALLDVFESGLVAPLNGESVLNALAAQGGAGLMDRRRLRAGWLGDADARPADGCPLKREAPVGRSPHAAASPGFALPPQLCYTAARSA